MMRALFFEDQNSGKQELYFTILSKGFFYIFGEQKCQEHSMLNELKKILILFIIRRNTLKTKLTGSQVSVYNAKKVGIIAVVDSKEKFELLVKFKKTLESYGPKVSVLGFAPFKIIPDYFNTQMQIEVFSIKEVNIFGIPRGDRVRHFINKEFDMLIDLTIEEIVPMYYLAGMSKAILKAGKYREQLKETYDIMIHTGEEMNYQEFQFTMKNYLSKINTTRA